MISELERRLSEAFHEDARRARLTHPDAPATTTVHVDGDVPEAGRRRRGWWLAAAAALLVLVIGVAAVATDRGTDRVQTSPAPSAASSFVLHQPSSDEEARATDLDLYRDGDVGMQITASGTSVLLRRCRDAAVAECGTGWAYVTGLGGGEVHGGVLGEANGSNLHTQSLDDRYVVVWESAPDSQAPSSAWLIDGVSGASGRLAWLDEPTTLDSPDERLLLCDESYSSFASSCGVVRGPDAADGGWTFSPSQGGLPKVVDVSDGTIRPLAMPAGAVAGLPVAQHGTDRIWIGTAADGDRLGLAYSDDGGATWHDVALPDQIGATTDELTASLVPYGDDLLEIAADGDRLAVARSWGGDDNAVLVSQDAGTTWRTASSEPGGNGVHLYVLADGRLVVMGSMDTYPSEVLASSGSDWADIEQVDVGFDDPSGLTQQRFNVNRAGVAVRARFSVPCDGVSPCPGYTDDEAERSALVEVQASTDLANWSTVQIPAP